MADVARAAGVSKTLVSIVFRDAPGASEQTRARVLQAAERIGYVRDERARMLRSNMSTDLGVCFSTRDPMQHDLLDGLYRATANTRYNLILSGASQTRTQEEAIASLVAFRCGALIALGPQLSDERLLAVAQGVPVVCVARPATAPGLDSVTSDDLTGIRQAVEHLAGLGHRRIALLYSPGDSGSAEREAGFQQAVRALGVEGILHPAGRTSADGARAMAEILASPGPRPTAVIGFNDRCAKGALDLLLRRGIAVPQEMSVVGYDDSEIAQLDHVRLTTVRQDTERIARFAAERAIQRLSGIYLESQPAALFIPTEFVIRETTGPPPQTD